MGGVGGHVESSISKIFQNCNIGLSSGHRCDAGGVGSFARLEPENVGDDVAEVGAQQ